MGWVLSPVGWVFISPAKGTAVVRPVPAHKETSGSLT